MHERLFAKSGDSVSEIGLGCWQLGGMDWGHIDDASAFKILREAVDSGVSFLDTADVYGHGRSETLIGAFLKQHQGRLFVATKLGRLNLYPDKYTRDSVRQAVTDSLARLEVDALDLVQLHCIPVQVLQEGEVFAWLEELQRDGLIRNWGASVESAEEAWICLRQPGLASLQIIFNIFRQYPSEAFFSEAKAKGVSLIVRLPLASGLLTGKFRADTEFAQEDHRNFNRDGAAFNVGETFAGLPYSKGLEFVEQVRGVVPEGWSMADLAMRWILDHDAVTTVIPGASKPEQARANARASSLPRLPEELHRKLRELYTTQVAAAIRGPL